MLSFFSKCSRSRDFLLFFQIDLFVLRLKKIVKRIFIWRQNSFSIELRKSHDDFKKKSNSWEKSKVEKHKRDLNINWNKKMSFEPAIKNARKKRFNFRLVIDFFMTDFAKNVIDLSMLFDCVKKKNQMWRRRMSKETNRVDLLWKRLFCRLLFCLSTRMSRCLLTLISRFQNQIDFHEFSLFLLRRRELICSFFLALDRSGQRWRIDLCLCW